ncbi:MAG: polysaccharide biosynthesis/export family protein [Bacteroidetes bacterium]|nr:polysaccharide biosynthesis/export family protein [Bacteroidota bacterium]
MTRSLTFLAIIVMMLSCFSSCVTTEKATYFNNAEDTTFATRPEEPMDAAIQKNDILSVTISSANAEASALFNTTNNYQTTSSTSSGNITQTSGYLVNNEGYIQLPILGNIKAAGVTRKQLKTDITNMILDKKLLIDPIVTVRFLNYEVTVLGEVTHPTVISVPNERITLLKALGLAGDITIYGRKDNVLLIREIDGKRKIKRINLNSRNFLISSYYYLQPNDVVYVEANKEKVAAASRNPQLLPTILSGLSVVAVVITQLIK